MYIERLGSAKGVNKRNNNNIITLCNYGVNLVIGLKIKR